MLEEAGPDLDTKICLALNGERGVRVPPYSTSERTARRLIRRLEDDGFTVSLETSGPVWYCALLRNGERTATGSAETWPLALGRAVVRHVPGPPPPRVRRRRSDGPKKRRRSVGRSFPRFCVDCGIDLLPTKTLEGVDRRCVLCGWKLAKAKSRVSPPAPARTFAGRG